MRNRVSLIGHVGNAPEVKKLKNDSVVANLSLATNESYKNAQGEKVTDTQWHRLVAWNGTAKIIEQYVKKGQEIAVEGKLVTREYETEGVKKYLTEVVIHEVVMLGSKNK
jgi:single-strand DNA-binding protein